MVKVVKNFLNLEDLHKIKIDLENNFEFNSHLNQLNSGTQTKPNLHLVNNGSHWKHFYNKLSLIMKEINKNQISKSWALKIDSLQNSFFHTHGDLATSILYVQNKNYELGTHLKLYNGQEEQEFIIPGYENSVAIFDGNIMHDAVFPTYKLDKPRFTLITDFI